MNRPPLFRTAALAIALAMSALPASGFTLDFIGAGLPSGVNVFGNAGRTASGGTGNSGALRLTDAVAGLSGSLVIDSLTGGAPVSTFDVTFDVFCGDGGNDPAEGISFCWGTNLPNGPWNEEGAGTGLIVSFDTRTDPGEPGHEVTVSMNNSLAGRVAFESHNSAWTSVHIRLRPGGLLDVKHGSTVLFAGLPLPGFIERNGPRYGWGAATGSGVNVSRQWLDNILINAQPIMVTKGSDSGAGTLRAAGAAALAQPGPDQIHFAESLSGLTVMLTSGEIAIGAQTLAVDASSLENGVTLSGGGTSRIFNAVAGSDLTLGALTLTGGAAPGGNGGAIFNQGTLSLHRCTLTGNTAGQGGGLYNTGSASLLLCTLAANSAASGGALRTHGPLTLTECTLSNNIATVAGGAVAGFSPLAVSGCIVAGNTAPAAADIHNEGTLTRTSVNLIQSLENSGAGTDSGPPALNAAPQLFPLARHGGPTPTMVPRPASPALDRVASSTSPTDQRGLPRVLWGLADLGAVEAGISAEYAWEVREIFRSPATALQSLNDALALAADPGATVVSATAAFINCHDPDAPGSGGFFSAEKSFASNNLTPQGLVSGDDNDFVTVARTFIQITEADDYTFGFSSSEGARLRVFGASFTSSAKLNPFNPANPAHSGDTLSYPGLTGNADTLGVCFLQPGVYPVEFVTWERDGGAYCEVFAARGARSVADSTFRLIGDTAPGGTLDPGTESRDIYTQSFNSSGDGWTVANVNAPFEGPWTYDAVRGTWATAGQEGEVMLSPSTTLTSPLITATCTGEALFYFDHRHSFEGDNWDGGQLRASINGEPFGIVPDTSFLENGYLGIVEPTSEADIRSQEAFVGDSPSYVTSFSTSVASLGVLETGDTVRLQLHASYDTSIRRSDPSWELDFARLAQACSLASGWNVSVIRNGAASLDEALTHVFAHWSGVPQPNTVTDDSPILHYQDPEAGGGGHGLPQTAFPGNLPGNDDNFALGARATLRIATAGEYTFCLLCDDGARLRIPGSRDWSVSSPDGVPTQARALPDGFQAAGGGADVFGRVFLQPGNYDIEVIYQESTGPAYLGLWGAAGGHTVWHPRVFRLLGGSSPTVSESPFPVTAQPGLPDQPLHDDFAAALPLYGSAASAVSSNLGATIESGEPSEGTSSKSIWWTWTAPGTGTWRVDTSGSLIDTVLDVFTGSALTGLTSTGTDDNDGGGNASLVCFTAAHGTAYHIRVRGRDGAGGAVFLNLTPFATPANDTFAAASPLRSAASLTVSANNCGATAQAGEPAHGNAANGSLWFTWTAPAAGDFRMDTFGSGIDTVLSVYTGSALNNLTFVAANDDDDGPGTPQSSLTFRAAAGVTYRIAVDGASAADRGAVRLNITHQPAILLHTLTQDAPPAATRRLLLRWRSEPWVTYRIEQSDDLAVWTTVQSRTASEGTMTDIELTGLPGTAERLYFRVAKE